MYRLSRVHTHKRTHMRTQKHTALPVASLSRTILGYPLQAMLMSSPILLNVHALHETSAIRAEVC